MIRIFILFFILFSCVSREGKKSNVLKNVNNFIGTGGHGHTYPGVSLPFSLVQLSPDNGISAWDWCSGYNYNDSIIVGFSHTHLSGTGIGDLCDVLIMPTTKDVDLTKKINSREDYDFKSKFSHDKESATPGYYSVWLEDDIFVELTSTRRTGMHRYNFSDGTADRRIVIDLGYSVNWDEPMKTKINIEDDKTIVGYRMSRGWAEDQRVFFVIKFSEPIKKLKLSSDGAILNNKELAVGKRTSALLDFKEYSKKIIVKVGISSVSIEGARNNLEKENNGWDFDKVKKNSMNIWNDNLNSISVETSNEDIKTIFYTALYRTQLAPHLHSDIDNNYRAWDQKIYKQNHDYYSTLSLWDVFRASMPLLSIIQPDKYKDFVMTMLHHYNEYGLLPVWTLWANETNCMTGYHSIPVISDALRKGFIPDSLKKDFYNAAKSTMMADDRGLKYYKKYGYIPYDSLAESVTISLEYGYDDWCVAQMANVVNKSNDYEYFMNRSKAYKYLYDKKTGFMRGKDLVGKWRTPFDPKRSEHRENTDYTEGNAWQHSWFVLHDIEGMINIMGGKEAFSDKLDRLFSEDSDIQGENVSPDISGLIGQYAHGNEPSQHIAYLYNYAGKPWKTQEVVRGILKTQYSNAPDGLSGNEDCGQMSAWYVFSSMGLYPTNPSSSIYDIGSPIFDKITINLKNGKKFKIEAIGNSEENIYVKSISLNGNKLDRLYITHNEIIQGGTLVFHMDSKPNKNLAK